MSEKNLQELIEEAVADITEEDVEYQIIELPGDDGETYEFAITDYFEYEDETYAVLNFVEGDEVTDAYIIFAATVDEENEEVVLDELEEESEDLLNNLYYEQFIKPYLEEEEEEE
ncbi:MAG: DUF1292 domain-containing protein [Dorea sp.]|nr:DUF1292 domain-containing protein [Dorea sp.]